MQDVAAADNTRLNLIIANHESPITSLNSNLQNVTDLNSNLKQQLSDTIAAHSAHLHHIKTESGIELDKLQQVNQQQKIEIQNLNQKLIDIHPSDQKKLS